MGWIDIGDTIQYIGAIRYGAVSLIDCRCQAERYTQEAISGQSTPRYVPPVTLKHAKYTLQRKCALRTKYNLEVHIFQGRCATCGRVYQGWHYTEWYTKPTNYRPSDFRTCPYCNLEVPFGPEYYNHIGMHVDHGDAEKLDDWRGQWLLDMYNATKD